MSITCSCQDSESLIRVLEDIDCDLRETLKFDLVPGLRKVKITEAVITNENLYKDFGIITPPYGRTLLKLRCDGDKELLIYDEVLLKKLVNDPVEFVPEVHTISSTRLSLLQYGKKYDIELDKPYTIVKPWALLDTDDKNPILTSIVVVTK